MDKTNKHLDNLKDAVRQSLLRKIDDDSVEIIDLDVIRCANIFIKSDFNKIKDSFDKLMASVREAEKAEDDFSKLAISSIHNLGSSVTELRKQLEQKPSEMARAGGKGRKKKYDPLVQRAIELYEAKNWHSARQAARYMESEIVEMGKNIGVPLTGEQPWETIQKWILKYAKK